MLRFMERNTYCMGVGFSKSNFYVDFITSNIFAEHPHFSLIIQCIHNRTFGIVIAVDVHDDLHSLIRCDAQLNDAILVFLTVITEAYSEDFDLQAKIF